jgi:hypothetical protein
MSKPDIDPKHLYDIQITDRLWIDQWGDFFHCDKFNHYCTYICWMDTKICEECGYSLSEKEKFIMKLVKFNA